MTASVANPSRRRLLAGLSALSAGLALSPATSGAQTPQAPPGNPRRLDLHHHFGSPRWIRRVGEVKRLAAESVTRRNDGAADPRGTEENDLET